MVGWGLSAEPGGQGGKRTLGRNLSIGLFLLASAQHFPSTSPLPQLLGCFKRFSSRFRARGVPSLEEEDAHCGLLIWLGAMLVVAEAGRGLGVGGWKTRARRRPDGAACRARNVGTQGWKRRAGHRLKLEEQTCPKKPSRKRAWGSARGHIGAQGRGPRVQDHPTAPLSPFLCFAAPSTVKWCQGRGCHCSRTPGAGVTSSSTSTSPFPRSSLLTRKSS